MSGYPRLSRFVWALVITILPVLVTLAACLPGRLVVAGHEAQFGLAKWQFLLGGFAGDLAVVMPIIALLMTGYTLGARILVRRQPDWSRDGRSGRIVGSALTFVLWLLVLLFSNSAAEYKVQRGLYPTLLEVRLGLSDATFVKASWPLLVSERFLTATILGAMVAGLIMVAIIRYRVWPRATLLGLVGFCAGWLGVAGVCGGFVFASPKVLHGVSHQRILYPPLVTILKGLGSHKTSIFNGLRGALQTLKPTAAQADAGAHAIGFRSDPATVLEPSPNCAAHPLARQFPEIEASGEGNPEARELLSAWAALSKAVLSDVDPLTVWQIAVESYRGDDIAALNPTAPAEITPFTNSLYAEAERPDSRVVAFPHAYQAATRTAHALTALTCGLGSMPLNLALLRDLGYFPARCLPDVLADAGFLTRAYYGADISYDNMIEYLHYHGVATTHNVDFPKDLPKGVWDCVTDSAVYGYAVDKSSKESRSQYNFVLTLSGHIPFTTPQDLKPETRARVERERFLENPSEMTRTPLNRRRLLTMAYADDALQGLLERLENSPLGARSLVIISADHATADDFLWRSAGSVKSTASMPLLFFLPRPLLARSQRAAEVQQAISKLNQLARRTPVSSNDVPTMILALLSATPQVRGIASPWRWHTMGGMATSPWFATPTGQPRARIWGINAVSHLYSVPEDGIEPVLVDENNPSFSSLEQLATMGPLNSSVGALLSAMLQGYATRCISPESIRASAVREVSKKN